jgi:AcrR family transcriptional regulator
MSKRQDITLQTKQNIIDAFWTLYCEKRIEKITIKDITNKAGYNRGTFYEYFKDVYDVLEHIENSLIPSINELPPITIGTETLGMPTNALFELYEKNSKYYSVLLGDSGDPAFASKLKKTIKPMIMQELLNGQDTNPVEMDYILEYTLSAMIGIMSYWSSHTDRFSEAQLHELINRLMQQGVAKQLSK